MNKIGLLIIGLLILIPAISAFTLSVRQGYGVIVVGQPAQGGFVPYSYQWFSECPTCGSYSSVAGATNTIYYFNTSGATQLGIWNFLLQVTDNVGNIANSLPVGVNVTKPTVYTFNALSGLSTVANVVSIVTNTLSINPTNVLVNGANTLMANVPSQTVYTFNSLSGLSNVGNLISIVTDQNTIVTNNVLLNGANELYANVPSSGGGTTYTFNALSGLSNVGNLISIVTDQNTIKTNNVQTNGANQLFSITGGASGSTSNTIIIFQNLESNWLPALFFIFSMLLFLMRLIFHEDRGYKWVVMNALSALLMVIAVYFYVFSPVNTTSGATYVNNALTSNIVATVSQPAIAVNSEGFILIATITAFYVGFMIIYALRDMLEMRDIRSRENKW